MVAAITTGKSWTTESCTAAKLNTMISGSTIAGIDQSNMASSSGVVITSGSAPSDTDALWRDSGNSNIIKYYTGSAWAEVPGTGSAVPAGTIISHVDTTVPTGYLYCNGAAVSRATYSDLFTAINRTGKPAYGEGDGSTTFNLPDLRGYFLRGQDDSQEVDEDAGSRTVQATGGNTGDAVGSQQGDQAQLQDHTHTVAASNFQFNYNEPGDTTGGLRTTSSINTGSPSVGTGDETRPKNVYVRYYIKT